MNLEHQPITPVLFITLCALLCVPIFFPQFRLTYFAPFMIILLYQQTRLFCLWAALVVGTVLDILSDHSNLGLHAIAYALAVFLLYGQRFHFFADSLTTLPIMTFFFAMLSTTAYALLLYLFEHRDLFSFAWIFSDLFMMSAGDALYAWILFVLPVWYMARTKLFRRA